MIVMSEEQHDAVTGPVCFSVKPGPDTWELTKVGAKTVFYLCGVQVMFTPKLPAGRVLYRWVKK